MRPSRLMRLLAVGLLALALAACGGGTAGDPSGGDQPATADPDQPVSSDDPTPMPTPEPEPGSVVKGEDAFIRSINVLILESFPVQIHVNIKGDLPDGCTTIAEITSAREENTFTVTIITQRPVEAMCTQALVPFEQNVALDVYGLPAGDYAVVVYDQTSSFTLTSDNILPDAP